MTKGIYSPIVNISEKDSYLIPNGEVRGIGAPYAQKGSFFDASKPFDPTTLAGSGIQLAAIPSPISNKWIHLPDGTGSAPGLAFAGETNSGRYRIGSNNIGESINSDLVFDWNATRLRLDSGFSLDITDMTAGSVLFAGSGGRVSQDNSSLFWDDTLNRLGIKTSAAPARALEVVDTGDVGAIRITRTAASTYTDLYTNSSGNFNIWPSGNGAFVVGSTAGAQAFSLGVEQNGTGSTRLTASQFGGTGDAYVLLYAGGINWVAGIDRSDSDSFVWSATAPGTSNKMRLTTGGLLSIPLSNVLTSPGISITQASTGDAALLWSLSSSISYILGIDNSVSGDPLVLSTAASASAELGTGNILSITSGGLATWSRSDALTTPTQDLIQSSTGDAGLRWTLNGSHSYVGGIDNSDSDKWKLSYGSAGDAALGTNDRLTVSTAGLVTVTQYMNVGTTTDAAAQGDFAAGATQKMFYDESLGFLQLTSTVAKQLRLAYDGSNYGDLTVTAAGELQIDTSSNSTLIQDTVTITGVEAAQGAALTLSPTALSSGSKHVLAINGALNTGGSIGLINAVGGSATGQTASTEIAMFRFAPGTITWATGAITDERNFQILAPTLAFAGASTVTNAATLYISDAPQAGTNATITNPYALWVDAGVSRFDGNVGIGTSGPDRPLDVLSTAGPQMRLTYTDGSVYTDFTTGSGGDLTIAPSGGDITINGNLSMSSASDTIFTNNIQIVSSAATLTINSSASTSTVYKAGSLEVARFGNDGTVGINTATARRKLDVLDDTNPQLRLTHTDNTDYADFKVDTSGYLSITPSGALTQIVNSTTAQALHVYGTTTGPKYALLSHDGSVGRVGTNSGVLYLHSAGNDRWYIHADGHLAAISDGSYNIGQAGAERPASIHVATSVVNAGYNEFAEIADPAAGAANTGRLYCKDNGAGKTQLVVRFNSGAVQVIATEP